MSDSLPFDERSSLSAALDALERERRVLLEEISALSHRASSAAGHRESQIKILDLQKQVAELEQQVKGVRERLHELDKPLFLRPEEDSRWKDVIDKSHEKEREGLHTLNRFAGSGHAALLAFVLPS